MTCHDARPQLSALLDDALSVAEHQALEAHLAGCAECRRELEQLRGTVALLGRLAAGSRAGRVRRPGDGRGLPPAVAEAAPRHPVPAAPREAAARGGGGAPGRRLGALRVPARAGGAAARPPGERRPAPAPPVAPAQPPAPLPGAAGEASRSKDAGARAKPRRPSRRRRATRPRRRRRPPRRRRRPRSRPRRPAPRENALGRREPRRRRRCGRRSERRRPGEAGD